MLIVRELSLGPMRFSELARAVGGAPTDVLTRRLRDLGDDGIVARRDLDPPIAATVYELTEFGRGLEPPMLELARWGMGLQTVEEVLDLTSTSLPNAIRVILSPPPDFTLTLGLRSEGHAYILRFENGWIEATRESGAADLTLSGKPIDVVTTLVFGERQDREVEIEGDKTPLAEIQQMVEIPERLREEALAAISAGLIPA